MNNKNDSPSSPPERDVTITEIDSEDHASGANPTNPLMIESYTLLRSWKLQVLAHVSKRIVTTEPRKICTHINHDIALLHALVHLIPLGGAISLLFLNWTHYFVGPEFSSSTTLQFLAKFHELLMQASISECILHIIRYQAIHECIPLGGFSALLQTFHISYLWSLDFWSTLTSKGFDRRRKALFIATIPLLIILTTLVGPSSAILMIPRQGTPEVVDTHNWKASASLEEMFPAKVDKSNGLDINPNAFNHHYRLAIPGRKTVIGTFHDIVDSGIPRIGQVKLTSISGTENDDPRFYWATATIATQFIATELDMHRHVVSPNWRNITISIDFIRPVVKVGCIPFITENSPGSQIPFFKGDENSDISGLDVPRLTTGNTATESTADRLPPFWISPPDPMSASIIGIFVMRKSCDGTNSLTQDTIGCLSIQSCTISAFWETSQCIISLNDGPYSVQVDSVDETGPRRRLQQAPITLNMSGISTFHSEYITLETHQAGAEFLAPAFASALSEIPPWNKYHPQGDSPEGHPRFVFKTTQYGYGYKISTTSVCLSITVITIYCIVTISYIAYTLFTSSTSTAWNSPIELLLLALKSKQPRHLGYTSVGIDSVKTYREEVGIRVNECNELELVFDRDPELDTRNLTHVRPNVSY